MINVKSIERTEKVPFMERMNWGVAATLFALHLLAGLAFLYFSWANLLCLLLLHFLCAGVGLGMGYHRYFSHASYVLPKTLEFIVGFLGVLAFQTGPLTWAALHRMHHIHENRVGDPHSAGTSRFFAYMGWVFFKAPNGFRYRRIKDQVSDLSKKSHLVFLEDHFLMINLMVMAIAAFVFIGMHQNVGLFLWAVPLRIVFSYHMVWVVNSFAHSKIDRNLPENRHRESAKNMRWLVIPTFGESLHLNHHLYPRLHTTRKAWFDFDLLGLMIEGLAALGLAQLKSRAVRRES